MSTARDFLAAVQQRADAATDGPWSVYNRGVGHEVHWSGAHDDGVAFKASLFDDDATRRSDAEFIAAARTDVPRLVAALTAALDGQPGFIPTPPGPQRAVRDTDLRNAGIAEGWRQARAAITAALTPKENDS